MSEPKQYRAHPAAELLPLMDDKELDALAKDIQANGLKHPILLYQDMILDGRNRLRACQLAGVEPRFLKWQPVPGKSPATYVMSANLIRRHLDASQRAMIGAGLMEMAKAEAKERQGHRSDLVAALPGSSFGSAREKVAEVMHVSPRLITDAVKVKEEGSAALVEAVRNGSVPVTSAAASIRSTRRPRRSRLSAEREQRKSWTLPWQVRAMAEVILRQRSADDVQELARLLASPTTNVAALPASPAGTAGATSA